MTHATTTGAGEWRFDGLRALYVNCTLKRSPERSHTEGLIDVSRSIMERHGVAVTQLRAVDHDIATGVWPDMTGPVAFRPTATSARSGRPAAASTSRTPSTAEPGRGRACRTPGRDCRPS
jgi:hypothetical protein